MAVKTDGTKDRSALRIALVISRFNSGITQALLDGALDCLVDSGILKNNISVFWAPGAFELPQVVNAILDSNEFDGIVPLGCVIRGETPHFDYVCEAVTTGLARLALESSLPIVLGVLTVDNVDQARARSGSQSHKGVEAAMAMLQLLDTLDEIKQNSSGQSA